MLAILSLISFCSSAAELGEECIQSQLYPLLFQGESSQEACNKQATGDFVNRFPGSGAGTEGDAPILKTCQCLSGISFPNRYGADAFVANQFAVYYFKESGWNVRVSGPSPLPGTEQLFAGAAKSKWDDPNKFYLALSSFEPTFTYFGLTFEIETEVLIGGDTLVDVAITGHVAGKNSLNTVRSSSTSGSFVEFSLSEEEEFTLPVGGMWLTRRAGLAMALYTEDCFAETVRHLQEFGEGAFVPFDQGVKALRVIRVLLKLEVCYHDPLPGITVPASWTTENGAFILAADPAQREYARLGDSETAEVGNKAVLVGGIVGSVIAALCCCSSIVVFAVLLRSRGRSGLRRRSPSTRHSQRSMLGRGAPSREVSRSQLSRA